MKGTHDRAAALARLRVSLTYRWRHGRWPALKAPGLFTELVQHRKLYDRDPRLPVLADKIAAKQMVAAALGPEWVTPTLWQGTSLPLRPKWPAPFVVKSRHGSNQRAFVRAGEDNWDDIRRNAARWMKSTYGVWLDEWLYTEIPKGILVESFAGDPIRLPVDYKLYVFGGCVEYIQIHLDREHRHRWIVMDRHWRRVSTVTADPDPLRPYSLDSMIVAAQTLAQDLDFVRADFYEIDCKPRFAELTFYPGSGLDRFDPQTLDTDMGDKWIAAQIACRARGLCR